MSDFTKPIEHLQTQEEYLDVAPKKSNYSIGLPKKSLDYRIALDPTSVKTLVNRGHQFTVQSDAGKIAGFSDHEYSEAGAKIVEDSQTVFESEIILQTAPLDEADLGFYRPNQFLISPLYLPRLDKEFLSQLQKKQVTAVAMEYLKARDGSFPIVRMMSELAGASSILTAASYLTLEKGGSGILFGGITGIPPTKVVILGAGMVGTFAAKTALAQGSEVRVFDNNVYKLMRLQQELGQKVFTSVLNHDILVKELLDTDVLLGAHHSPTGRSETLISEDMVMKMKQGSVILDLSIDQGGCIETSHMTSLDDPVFVKHGVIHYCVPNMTSSYAHTASRAISHVLLPILLNATDSSSLEDLLYENPGFRNGVYLYKGCLTNKHLADRYMLKYSNLDLLLTWRG